MDSYMYKSQYSDITQLLNSTVTSHLSALTSGGADRISVSCVFVGDSSSEEVLQFTDSEAGSWNRENCRDSAINGDGHYDHLQEPLEECVARFNPTNPGNPAYKTVVVRNYRSDQLNCAHVHVHVCGWCGVC